MTLPRTDTRVTYPAGELVAETRVVHLEPLPDGRTAVLVESTSFHPVDAAWPDQPADRGVLRAGALELPIVDAVVGASDGERLFLGAEVPARPGAEGWAFVVAHLVADASGLAVGDAVRIEADGDYRTALSTGHTACHLAALALNAAVAGRWSKEARLDGLGHPDFDATAITRSSILENGSLDRYRLNKSLRRAGFDAASFLDGLAELDADVESRLAIWVGSSAPVRIERDGDGLSDRRYWVCELPEGTVRMACGGTHVRTLGEFDGIRVGFSAGEDAGSPVVEMSTSVERR